MIYRLLRTKPAVLILLLACLGITSARAAAVPCPQADVSVISSADEDVPDCDVCAAASTVFSFFRQLGLHKTVPLVVSIVASMPEEMGTAMLGCFTPSNNRISILSFEVAKSRGPWFGRPIDRSLYRSLAAHEIAHALAWCNTSNGPLGVRAREYVAYAVQFQTMDSDLRQAILADTPGTGFETEREISDTHFYLAPSRFGADAYRHYTRPEDGPRFLREILRGGALPVLDD
jgi:hypothetical protein